jgi:hypothetical protein
MKKLFFTLSLLAFPLAGQAQFSDTDGHPYQKAIQYAQENGIVNGYSGGSFKPDNQINRAEFVKIIIEAEFTAEEIENCDLSLLDQYSDLDKQEWYTPYICLATKEGIIQGYPDGSFKPEQMVNFVEAAKVIATNENADLEVDPEIWYKNFVEYLSDKKAIPPSINKLDKMITRAEMIEIIWRLENQESLKARSDYRYYLKEKLFDMTLSEKDLNNCGYIIRDGEVFFDQAIINQYTSIIDFMHMPKADVESIKAIGIYINFGNFIQNNYAIDQNNVYINGNPIKNADPVTFSLFGKESTRELSIAEDFHYESKGEYKCKLYNIHAQTFYAKDKNNVYWEGEIIPDSDGSSFVYLGNIELELKFAKDKNQVYEGKKVLTWAEPETFEIIGSFGHLDLIRDKNGVYNAYTNEKVKHEIIKDLLSFELFSPKANFAQDSQNIYLFNDGIIKIFDVADKETFELISCLGDRTDCYFKDKNNIYYGDGSIMENVDPATFEIINERFGKDKNDVIDFYNCFDASKVDPNTFELVGTFAVKDKDSVYYSLDGAQSCDFEKLDNVDPETFEYLEYPFYKDVNNVYFQGEIIDNADSSSFKLLNNKDDSLSYYSRDANNVFFANSKIEADVDLESFQAIETQALGGSFAIDKNQAYVGSTLAKNSDPETFELLGITESGMGSIIHKDKNNVYLDGQIIEEADTATFEMFEEDWDYQKDKNNVFYQGQIIEGADPATFDPEEYELNN